MGYKSWAMLGAAASALIWGTSAFAAEAPSTNENSIDEVVVTAQKREQSLQSVPGSVSAFGAEQIKARGIETVQDLASQTPGLDFGQHNGAAFVTLRGVGLAVDTGVAEPNVAVHVDGVFLPRTTMASLDYVDLERVEVVRGPQGTLYGRNATGGAINFISKAPSQDFGGEISGMAGNFETFEVKGMITGGLGDKAAGRLSAGYARRGEGYAENLFTGDSYDTSERYNVRGAVSVDVSDTVRLDLALQYQSEDFQTYQQLMAPAGPGAGFFFPPLTTAVSPSKPWTTGNNYNPDSKRSTLFGRVGLKWEVTPDLTLSSITGYIDHKFSNRIDGDGTSADYLVIRDRQQPSETISQEFNLSGNYGDRGTWIVGLYGFQEDFKSSIPVALPSGLPVLGLPPETILLSEVGEKTTSFAMFADTTVSVTDHMRFYGGIRFSKDEKDEVQSAGAIIPGVPTSLTLTCEKQKSSLSYSSSSPRFGVEYDITSDILAYVQYSRGFKSGGLNSSSCGDYYQPEKLESVEAGIKSQFLDGRATVNVSVFNYRYNDLQLFKIVGINAQIENADAHFRGADLEARFRFNDNWRVDGSATLLDATFTSLKDLDPAAPALGVQDLRGDDVPRTPRYLANLGLQGDFDVSWGPFSSLSMRADVRFSAKSYFQVFNTSGYEQEAYAISNATVRLATADDGLSVRVFVRNLTDEPIKSHVFYNQIQDSYLGNYLPPRTWGVELSRTF